MVSGAAVVPGMLVWTVPIDACPLAVAATPSIFAPASLPGTTSETLVLLGIALVFTFNANAGPAPSNVRPASKRSPRWSSGPWAA